MPADASLTQWLLQAGGVGAGVLCILAAFRAGWLATRQEVDAWKSRAERAEKQVDTLLPAIDRMAQAIRDRASIGGTP